MAESISEETQFDVWLRIKPYSKLGQKEKIGSHEKTPLQSPIKLPSSKNLTPIKQSALTDKSSASNSKSRSRSPFYKIPAGSLSTRFKFEQAELSKNDYKALSVKGQVISIDQQEKISSPSLNRKTKLRLHQINFPNIIPESVGNADLFDHVLESKVDECLRGGSFTMLTYGISGSGKSHTIFGKIPSDPGALMLAAQHIFNKIPEVQQEGRLLQVDLSFVEIYNEKVYDLLSPDRRSLTVIDSQFTDGVVLPDLIIRPLSDFEEFQEAVNRAQARRIVCPNMNNQHSSRSHIVVELSISITDKDLPDSRLVSRIKFVDLAGSEKVAKNNGGIHR